MNRDAIRESLDGRGPFLVRTSDGKQYPVPHPDFVFVGRFNVVIESVKGGVSIIDPFHIVAIQLAAKRRTKAA